MSQFIFTNSENRILNFDLPPMSETSAIAGALGSIIGYLGSEVAEPSVFERLLWPERFYNVVSCRNAIEIALFMPLGGPVHKAALRTLDVFRRKGLYEGAMQGHMLGTAFYPDKKLSYQIHGYDGNDKDREIRNGLWATVLQHCRYAQKVTPLPVMKTDSEAKGGASQLVRRTTQIVRHLRLWEPQTPNEYEKVQAFSEDTASPKILFFILVSEITAIFCAALIIFTEHCTWFGVYLCIPLLLKLLSMPLSVRRGPKNSGDSKPSSPTEIDEKEPLEPTVLFEISDYDHGFPLIEGSETVVRQFFKHWGHPLRQRNLDRLREIGGIALVVAFVFYFPVGLLSMLWVPQPVQIMWLSYQLYSIIAMHIMRLRGSNGRGRLEAGIAEELVKGKEIVLKSGHGGIVMAKLTSTPVERISHGQAKVQEIIRAHQVSAQLRRQGSDDSQITL
ncbi:hypothetical protein Vi05172_g12954 [Venturia inaequalis]|uniref:Uncharacterized protein n=1 Tax=Venturia inaequalis TaxID=5025 RepID=A0A8H3YRW6_VENIN|nr:hypothetical protein EG327_011569 [Venturia inaequalis]RDI77038.1 hypothetical protein Vi05172_g12954 [Venturia inaequalis]